MRLPFLVSGSEGTYRINGLILSPVGEGSSGGVQGSKAPS
jgi:hypothetical protein